jgi:hypothetical protein
VVLAEKAARLKLPSSVGVKPENGEIVVASNEDCSLKPANAVLLGEPLYGAPVSEDLAANVTQPLPPSLVSQSTFEFSQAPDHDSIWVRSLPAKSEADGIGWIAVRADHRGQVAVPWRSRIFETADDADSEASGHLLASRCDMPITLTQLTFTSDELDTLELFDDAPRSIMTWTKGNPSAGSAVIVCGKGFQVALHFSGWTEPLGAVLALPASLNVHRADIFLSGQLLGEATCSNAGPSIIAPAEESGQCTSDPLPATQAITWRQDSVATPRWSSPWLCLPANSASARVSVHGDRDRDEIAKVVGGHWQLQRPCNKGRFCECMLGNVSVARSQCTGGCAPARRAYPGCETATECLY